MADRKVPVRMCVSCRETAEKRNLLRVVRGSDGQARIDPKGNAPGRGAYLCGSEECFSRALKGKKLSRALRCEVSESLIRELENRVLSADACEGCRSSRDMRQ